MLNCAELKQQLLKTKDREAYKNQLLTMLLRLRHGRRFQTCLKYIASAFVAIVYFAFLFRESLNAFEQNKEKISSLPLGSELKFTPKLKRAPRLQHQYKQQGQNHSQTATVTAPTTINPIYEYSEELHSATEKDLRERNAHLNSICQRYDLQSQYPPNPWEFFISPGHNLVWCNVFKAASTTWMYYFNILGGYAIEFLQRSEIPPIELARKRFPRPAMYELLDSLSTSVSFLFVRDPLERVLSAYRNKFETGRNLYFKPLGKKIIRRFRKLSTSGTLNLKKTAPTFEEFVRYLIDENQQNKSFDEHWAPVYRFCTPCSVNFTIIGKVETFQRDAEYIIRQAGLESLLLGKLPKHKIRKIGNLSSDNIKSEALLEKYFSRLDRKTLDELLNIYRLDFELFNYDYSKYYNIISNATIKQGSFENTTTTVTANTNTLSSIYTATNFTTPK